MHAIITDGSISKIINHPKPLVIGDVQYPAKIFSVWTASELAAIGIIAVTFDDSKKKDERYYVNTNQSFTYDASAGTVTAAYGDATARAHADANGVDEDGNELDPVVVIEGLKTKFIRTVKAQAKVLLNETDWYITRKAEKNTAIPSAITTWRDGIRTKQAAMETSITNASDTPALETLYTYVNTADEGDPVVMERPLGELPTLES